MKRLSVLLCLIMLVVSVPALGAADKTEKLPADTLKHLDLILAKQKELLTLLRGIQSLDDLKASRDKYVALSRQIIHMTIASLKQVKAGSDKDAKAYMEKNKQMQKENSSLRREMRDLSNKIKALPGAKEYMEKLGKELRKEFTPLSKELMALYRDVIKKGK